MHSTTIYYNPEITLYAQELVAKMPKGSGLNKVYFTNSGSEANDLALLMARQHTGMSYLMAVQTDERTSEIWF